MSEKEININFDINAKCQSMIEEANKIIKVYLETTNLYEEDGRYNLAYDVKNYLPKLQQENQQLKQKYENAVADYESEKSKNQRAIKIIEDNYYSKNTTDIDSIVVSSNKFIQVRKILKGENNE